MAWVVDTCVLSDIWATDPMFAASSAECLDRHAADGLVISPVTFVELSPLFDGVLADEEQFLRDYRVSHDIAWSDADTLAAHGYWADSIRRKRQGGPKRPIADIFIAGFAMRFQGLITRNVDDFRKVAPTLRLVDASTFSPTP